MLSRIDEAVSAYSAGAANTGDPDAVIAEVAAILNGDTVGPRGTFNGDGTDVPGSLTRGLEQSAAGDVMDLGDSTQYADTQRFPRTADDRRGLIYSAAEDPVDGR
jgi:hypothetical protein